MPRLLCGLVCVILCLAVLAELRLVSDEQTDVDISTVIPNLFETGIELTTLFLALTVDCSTDLLFYGWQGHDIYDICNA